MRVEEMEKKMQKCAEDPKERMTTPQADGFFMPGEYEPHDGCILIWPSRPGSWIYGARDARIAFRDVIAAIAQSENVYVAAGRDTIDSAREMLTGEDAPWKKRVTIFELETDDAWARDVAPTFVKDGAGRVRAVNWSFNAWGGSVDGLYASWALDDAFAKAFAAKYGYACYDAAPFVLEGGSIHSDGEGTLLVTEACLLSAGRNPGLTREEIEEKWTKRHGGFCNTRRAQPTERHLSGFARYLTISKLEREGKNPQQKAVGRSWGSSIGLREPAESVADKKISVRKAGRVAETVADFNRAKEIFEKLYPGCELLEIGAKKSRWASGVYVHALMRRVDESGRTR